MWIYRWIESRDVYEVGFFTPTGHWEKVESFTYDDGARELVHYLNGGDR
jgi:hypothetical protein